MKTIHHTVNMPSVILVFLIEFVSMICCVPLNDSKLNCFNDYVTTMVCDFTSDKFLNCSGYSLEYILGSITPIMRSLKCRLKKKKIIEEEDSDYYRSKCGCTVELPEFVSGDVYLVNLTEGGKVINSTIITPVHNIKPKAPDILSVMPMENGNYKVTWNTNYPEKNGLFGNLDIELSYKRNGDKDARIVIASPPFHEIPGSDLEPNSKYVVKARSYSTHYNTQFSNWSGEVEWTSSVSVGSALKAVIPVLCLLLVINICGLYWCLKRLKAKWWDKIPAPKDDIKKMLPGSFPIFIPKHDDPSVCHTAILTIDKTEEKPRATPRTSECEQDDLYKLVSGHGLAKDSGVCLSDDSQNGFSDSVGSCISCESGYKDALYLSLSATYTQKSDSLELPGSGNPFPAAPMPACDIKTIYSEVEVLKDPIQVFHKTWQTPDSSRQSPRMITDFKHYSASTPPGKESFSADILDAALLVKAGGNITRADDGYGSFAEAVSRAAPGKAQFLACPLELDDGYRDLDLQTILENRTDWHSETGKADREASSVEGPEKSSGQEWELSKCPKWDILDSCASPLMQKSSVESSANPALTTSPIIQIYTDSSYHRV